MIKNLRCDCSYINETIMLRSNKKVLTQLLKDYTTNRNIRWATDSYKYNGKGFYKTDEIKIDKITGIFEGIIQPRIKKMIKDKKNRTVSRAEVYTPSKFVNLQISQISEYIYDNKLNILEVACGEAPYLVTRYDVDSGEYIELSKRIGILDRKLQKLNAESFTEIEYETNIKDIYKSVYAYEFQGDSLLLARENLLYTFVDYYFNYFNKLPSDRLILDIAKIISINLFQMDGLNYQLPFSKKMNYEQISLFENVNYEIASESQYAKIKNWSSNNNIEFNKIVKGDQTMKFDVIIGNPPYQVQDNNSGKGSAKPIYHHFIREAIKLNPQVLSLVVPSVWFTGGKGLDNFRYEMLNDIHIKRITNFITPDDIFKGVNLRGGVNIFYWNSEYNNTINGVYTENVRKNKVISSGLRPLKILDLDVLIVDNKAVSIIEKINKKKIKCENNFEDLISSRNPFGFTTNHFQKEASLVGKDQLIEPIKIYGSKNKVGFVERNSIKKNEEMISKWKLCTPFANNIGTDLPDDNINFIISEPNSIVTETYLTIGGNMDFGEKDCLNIGKYIQSKFVRFLISQAKANQNGTKKVFKLVPFQNFESNEDINWELNIDKQLYEKYRLDEDEILHIENSIKEME